MGFLEDLFGAVKTHVGAQGEAVQAVVLPWGRRLLQSGMPKMLSVLQLRKMCEVANTVAPGTYSDCPEQAAVRCVGCGKYCCLSHGFLSHKADAVCWVCIDKMLNAQRAAGPSPGDFRGTPRDMPPRAAPPGGAGPQENDAIAKAFEELNLTPNASESEVRAAFKALSKKYHPDRNPNVGPREAREFEARMKRISHAFHLLKRHFEQAA